MTEPIKPRMDFSDTPQSSEEMRLKPGKIFAEQQASLFSIPETEVSGQETQKSVTDLENTLLNPGVACNTGYLSRACAYLQLY